MTSRKSYNRAFKEEAIRLAGKFGVAQVASDLVIHLNMIYTWKRQLTSIFADSKINYRCNHNLRFAAPVSLLLNTHHHIKDSPSEGYDRRLKPTKNKSSTTGTVILFSLTATVLMPLRPTWWRARRIWTG
ncbi:hypothetical protein DCM91_20725 [Chitinophaga costaii]|uniref:transposase n=1 Tax=Chitinophaga costaii TaxID=1335309 RepID=UPI000D3E9702|nr:hypothetical protein DCM91_20725 [Chitinophaga costaii]